MSDLVVLENGVRDDGIRFMRVMSGERIDVEAFTRVVIPVASQKSAVVSVESDQGTGMFYLSAEWDVHEAVNFIHPSGKDWQLFLYRLADGERVSLAAVEAAGLYHGEFGKFPEFAWMKRLPKMPEGGEWLEVPAFPLSPYGDFPPRGDRKAELLLLQADWVPERCIAVSC